MQTKLEIILITYNRKEHLERTFEQIFSPDSPIKNFPITILDNKSDDGTSELIQLYKNQYPNIKHIIHNRNIGGNANIARAFEICSQEYVWVLCDDDEFEWQAWAEVESALEKDYDLIVVANYENPQESKPKLIKQLTFVPAAIYRTEFITDTVMTNANFNISTLFPQLAIVSKFINDNKKIYICKNPMVRMCINEDSSYTRGLDSDKHPYLADTYWHFGYCNAIQLLKDEKLRLQIIEEIIFDEKRGKFSFFLTCFRILDINKYLANNSTKNLHDFYCVLNIYQKIKFLIVYALDSINIRGILRTAYHIYANKIYANKLILRTIFKILFYFIPEKKYVRAKKYIKFLRNKGVRALRKFVV